MKPLLVVDGYNVIGAWELAAKKGWSFEECREQLTVRLEEYAAFHGCEVILVFDGTRSERTPRSAPRSNGARPQRATCSSRGCPSPSATRWKKCGAGNKTRRIYVFW